MMSRSLCALALVACGGPASSAPGGTARPPRGVSAPVAPAAVAPMATSGGPVERLSLSSSGGCWLRDGQVWCWSGAPAELEGASVRIALPEAALDADGALRFGCAVLASGAVRCWGDNTWGQLGAASRAPASEVPIVARGLEAATSIAVGTEHACATLKDGSVMCWGNNASGQCGHDREYAPAVRQLVRPERVEGVQGARRVVVSAYSSCALGESRTWCWGELLRLRDGNGPATDRTRATPIAPLARARDVALGAECGCAVSAERAVACFALSAYGCPSADVRAGLEPRFGWNDVQRIAVGRRGACAAHADGRVDCWAHPPDPRAPDASFPSTPGVPAPRPLASTLHGVPLMADGPCIFDGRQLACWGEGFWDSPAVTTPLQIRLP
jgi:hypothetical protein